MWRVADVMQPGGRDQRLAIEADAVGESPSFRRDLLDVVPPARQHVSQETACQLASEVDIHSIHADTWAQHRTRPRGGDRSCDGRSVLQTDHSPPPRNGPVRAVVRGAYQHQCVPERALALSHVDSLDKLPNELTR